MHKSGTQVARISWKKLRINSTYHFSLFSKTTLQISTFFYNVYYYMKNLIVIVCNSTFVDSALEFLLNCQTYWCYNKNWPLFWKNLIIKFTVWSVKFIKLLLVFVAFLGMPVFYSNLPHMRSTFCIKQNILEFF